MIWVLFLKLNQVFTGLKELNDLGIAGLKAFNIEIDGISRQGVSGMVDCKRSQIHSITVGVTVDMAAAVTAPAWLPAAEPISQASS
jgi:hypothetical protein